MFAQRLKSTALVLSQASKAECTCLHSLQTRPNSGQRKLLKACLLMDLISNSSQKSADSTRLSADTTANSAYLLRTNCDRLFSLEHPIRGDNRLCDLTQLFVLILTASLQTTEGLIFRQVQAPHQNPFRAFH